MSDEIREWQERQDAARATYYAEHIEPDHVEAARKAAKRAYDHQRYLERKQANA